MEPGVESRSADVVVSHLLRLPSASPSRTRWPQAAMVVLCTSPPLSMPQLGRLGLQSDTCPTPASINPSTNESINQPMNQPIHQPTNQSVNPSITPSISQPNKEGNSQSHHPSVHQLTTHLIIQSIHRKPWSRGPTQAGSDMVLSPPAAALTMCISSC